ncbi:MAG: sensor histidine kinase [Weeksellaceae bacterium]
MKNIPKIILKNILEGLLIAIVLVIIHYFYYQQYNEIEDLTRFLTTSFIYNALYAIPFYVVNAMVHGYAREKEKETKLSEPMYWLRFLVIIVLINTILAIGIKILSNLIDGGWDRLSQMDLSFFITALIISFSIGGFFYSYFYLKAMFDKKSAKQEAKITQVTQSHEALKSQIGPHFLFNSLNVLSGLVDENPDKAQKFIADLAQVYRYVLDQKDKDWVSVAEEIQFAENYLALIKTRFENGLDVEIEENLKTSELQIAPLTLQLLLENCIKHNGISKEKPLEIHIFRFNDTLVVENNLNLKKVFQEREGTGLNQIKQRYAFVNKKVKVMKDDQKFRVEVPLLEIEDLN